MTEQASHSGTLAVDREALILDHMPLLHHIVGRMSFDIPGKVEREDLMGWGMIGLILAADSWESFRGLKFSTYAYPKIRGAILDEIRRLDFLPRGRRERLRDLDRVVSELEHQSGCLPSLDEIAAALDVTIEEVDQIMHSARVAGCVSLDEGPSEKLASLLSDPSSEDPVGSAEWEELKAILVKSISKLGKPEQTVITLYYGEELLLKDIGTIMGVSESRVSQIHTRAVYCLNREMTSMLGSP